jgi:NTP pyrophosphatase (non-canonical NTP hydrolase)
MGEEMGEIARILECMEGYRATGFSSQQLRQELAGELADLMAFLFKLASQYDIDMGEAMKAHLRKFVARNADVEQGRQEMARYVLHQEKNLGWIRGLGE